jgi:hypothetical protein
MATPTDVKYPQVQVRLVGTDGNAFLLVGKVRHAMRRAGIPQEEISAVVEEAMSGDYDHLLQTLMDTVDVQ